MPWRGPSLPAWPRSRRRPCPGPSPRASRPTLALRFSATSALSGGDQPAAPALGVVATRIAAQQLAVERGGLGPAPLGEQAVRALHDCVVRVVLRDGLLLLLRGVSLGRTFVIVRHESLLFFARDFVSAAGGGGADGAGQPPARQRPRGALAGAPRSRRSRHRGRGLRGPGARSVTVGLALRPRETAQRTLAAGGSTSAAWGCDAPARRLLRLP